MTPPTFYHKFYDLETYILKEVREKFDHNGQLSAFDFFCIVIWKANRAKTKIAERLLKYNSNLEQSVQDLTSKIFSATGDKQKLRVLIVEFKFRLPMASAILSLLYPDNFTIYDVRVCETLTNYKGLDSISNFEKLWLGYADYINDVRNYEPRDISLRDKDRLLWGKSFHEQLTMDIKANFKK